MDFREPIVKQACAIPFRRIGRDIEFCLITTRQGKSWAFPKGTVDPGESVAEAAMRETREEAGVRGRIIGEALGDFLYQKNGSNRHVTAVLIEVEEIQPYWKEAALRSRRWVSPAEARILLNQESYQRLLKAAVERVGDNEAGTRRF